jgi:hypothetical protein
VKQQAEWTRQHELTREQFKQLIQNKINRAELYRNAKLKTKPERDFQLRDNGKV